MSTSGMKLAVRAASLGDDLRALAPVAQRLAYRGVQLDLRLGELDLTELSATGQREVRHLLSRHDLELCSIKLQLPADALMGVADAGQILWLAERAMKAASGLAARMLCLDIGRLPGVRHESRPKPVTQRQAGRILIPEPATVPEPADPSPTEQEPARWTAADATLRELGVLADRYSIVVALSSELSSVASLKRAIEQAACPWFGVDLDPVSVLRDHWDLEHILNAVGSQLRHVRARDAIKGSGGRTQPAPIGSGSTNWRELLALLSQGAYNGWLTVDTTDLQDRAKEAVRARTMLS